ncbi:DNA translocase FtsK [Rhizobium rhizosphaerae]|uniref:DNA translocase FtsK n=1 Tax=Xaviernesmea rhizosphaerae TaxID=1672749 RepID=UPI0009BF3817|nr:DNA translocase FtsK [Xaviernesmea rhizosphaerae]
MRLPRTNFPHGLDNAGEAQDGQRRSVKRIYGAPDPDSYSAIGENADEIAAGQIEGRIEAPIWQSNFVIGPNVRFTRTPENAIPKRPRLEAPEDGDGDEMPGESATAQAPQEEASPFSLFGQQPSLPSDLSFLHAAFTPPADSPLHEHAAARGALALALRLRRALEAEEAQNKGLVIDAEAHRTPVTEVTAEAPDPALKPARADLDLICFPDAGESQATAEGWLNSRPAEATTQDEATASIPPQDTVPETHAAAQMQPEQTPETVAAPLAITPQPISEHPSAVQPGTEPASAPAGTARAALAAALPDFLFFEALACNPDLGFDDLPEAAHRAAEPTSAEPAVAPEAAGPAEAARAFPQAEPAQADAPAPSTAEATHLPAWMRNPVEPVSSPVLDGSDVIALYRAIDCRASAPLFPLLSAPQPAPAPADAASVVADAASTAVDAASTTVEAAPGIAEAAAEAVAGTPAPAATPATLAAPAEPQAPAARAAAPVDFNRLPFSIPRAALWADSGDDYDYPPVELLQEPPVQVTASMTQEALEQSAGLLESVLEDFGVRGEIIDVRPGPVVTLYEFEPAPGVKSSRVIGLSDDIARSMSALSARVAVVPGRNVIGIELPNPVRETVYFRDMIESASYGDTKFKLALCLGKTIGGEPVIAELAKMPHLLVAGTTGSGKSVAINTMILSLLYRLKPEECRLIMVDPKMLELSVYDGIPHLLTPVVTDPKKAVMALKWAVREMEERYKKMSRLGVRNIDGYNSRAALARAKGESVMTTVQTGFDRGTGEPVYEEQELDLEAMPYIVIIVDEMADLMMVAGKEIEGAIQRLAQMARAAGIHLIMATQRPSVDVITGTIKANFPTRISFQVTSKIDSRTILGEQGAEHLLGQGDMLHMIGGGRIARVHGPFVSDEEVEKVVAHLKLQGRPDYLGTVTEDADEADEAPEEDTPVFDKSALAEEDGQDLFDKAVKVVLRDKKCSTSYIQRRLGIGYNRAASLVERMEKEGIVGPANHVGKRSIIAGTGREPAAPEAQMESED